MRRLCFVAAIVTAILGQLSAQQAFALATDEIGNKPLSELNYTEWKGIVPIVNDKASFGGWPRNASADVG